MIVIIGPETYVSYKQKDAKSAIETNKVKSVLMINAFLSSPWWSF